MAYQREHQDSAERQPQGDHHHPHPQIRVDAGNSNVMQFVGGTGGDFNGAQIERTVNLNGATGGSLSYSVTTPTGLEADDNVTVFFSRNGTTFVQVDVITNTSLAGVRNIDLSTVGTGPFTANAVVRFVATSLETGELVTIDSLTITGTGLNSGVETLNGGVGDDTYSFTARRRQRCHQRRQRRRSTGTASRSLRRTPRPGTGLPSSIRRPVCRSRRSPVWTPSTTTATPTTAIW